jgi:uncharacterized RDD family membrane protein YckC
MSNDQPPSASGPEDPFSKPPPYGEYGGSPYGAPPPAADLLAGMPPLGNRGKRLVARIVDALIVGIPVYALSGLAWGRYDLADTGETYGQSLIYAVVYLVYQVVFLTRDGQSLGKKLMKLRVGMLSDGSTPTSQAALKREATYALVPLLPCCGSIFWLVNVLWCLWDKPYQQCLHDKAAHTVVVAAEAA